MFLMDIFRSAVEVFVALRINKHLQTTTNYIGERMANYRSCRVLTLSIFIAVLMVCVACNSGSGTASSGLSEQTETIYGLGECTDASNGVTKLVTSENRYYKCENGNWNVTVVPTDNSGAEQGNILYDSRDGQTYKTVTIGTQTWMAENLKYKTFESYCCDDILANCDVYGRLYTKSATMDACPEGWHLPSSEEWETLIEFAGGDKVAAIKLAALSGWEYSGSDDYGFSLLPDCRRRYDGEYNDCTSLWGGASEKVPGESVLFWACVRDRASAGLESEGSKGGPWSVRCVKD